MGGINEARPDVSVAVGIGRLVPLDAACSGYFIYKKGGRFTESGSVYPHPEDIIELVHVEEIENNAIAKVQKSVKISGPHYHPDKRYLGATYFDDHLDLINQDTEPVHIIKIYLPLE